MTGSPMVDWSEQPFERIPGAWGDSGRQETRAAKQPSAGGGRPLPRSDHPGPRGENRRPRRRRLHLPAGHNPATVQTSHFHGRSESQACFEEGDSARSLPTGTEGAILSLVSNVLCSTSCVPFLVCHLSVPPLDSTSRRAKPMRKNMEFYRLLKTLSIKRAEKIMKNPAKRIPIRSSDRQRIDVELACDEFRISCDFTSDFNLDFLTIAWSNRCAVCGVLHCFLSSFRVSSDRENRKLAGKLNDPGKQREMAGNFAKRRKIREFSFNHINFKKEKCEVRFWIFFPWKKQNHFF